MRPRFLADENLDLRIVIGLRRREPSIDFLTASAAGILGLADPEVLALAVREDRILVSHDRATLPALFSRFIVGMRSPGLLIVSRKLDLGEAIDQILVIWAASDASEWVNNVGYLPF